MGFPYDSATWDAVDGAMYMGWGGGKPWTFTLISAIVCVVLLFIGNRAEHQLYKRNK